MYGDFGHFEFEFKKGTYRSKKIFLLIRWSQSTHRSLSLKELVKKVYRAFITDTNQISAFSSVPPYYIQLPYIRWPSILVAIAHPHLAMTFSLVTTPCRRGFCAVIVPPCWPLVPYLPHPSLPPLLIRWILSRSSLVMTITPLKNQRLIKMYAHSRQ